MMLGMLKMELRAPKDHRIIVQESSMFQGVMMEQIERTYGEELHESGLHPYSCHLLFENDKVFWVVKTLNKEAFDRILRPLLAEDFVSFEIKKKQITVDIVSKQVQEMPQKELMNRFYEGETNRYVNFEFLTPTAFKSNGQYVMIPTPRLIWGSLMNKYSASSMLDMTDDETLEQMSENSVITAYHLRSYPFSLEGIRIPAFRGELTIRVSGPETMVRYANLLAEFGEFSGIGIKCGMGMGAVRIDKKGRLMK